MELFQESILRSVGVIAGWEASPLYADYRGRLTERFRELLGSDNDWAWDGASTLVFSEERGVSVGVSPTDFIVFSEKLAPDLGDLPAEASAYVLDQLSIPSVSVIGSASIWLAPASTEEKLNDWLAECMGPLGQPVIYDGFGGKPRSFSFQADIGDDDLGYEVELQPMTAAEAAEGEDLMSEDEADFPPVSLYLEVRRAKAGQFDSGDAVQLISEALEKNLTAAQKFDAALRATL